MQLIDAHHPLPELEVAVERRQVLVHAVDQARVDRHRDVRAVEGLASDESYFRAFAKNATFCTSPFIVVPNVRLKLAERAEERRHHLLAIPRFGSARRSLKAA